MIEYATLESQGIVNSDAANILLPTGRGAHVELGTAITRKKSTITS